MTLERELTSRIWGLTQKADDVAAQLSKTIRNASAAERSGMRQILKRLTQLLDEVAR